MPVLTVWQDGRQTAVRFEGAPLLAAVLASGGFAAAQPCGGRGVCGKCAVRLTGAVSEPNAAERAAGARLACQAVLLGDAEAVLPDAPRMEQIALDSSASRGAPRAGAGRIGAAVDLGTTTIALHVIDLQSGERIGQAAALNPQTSVAADVMGRISASMNGERDRLRRQACDGVQALLQSACAQAGHTPDALDALVLTGNTTMLYLLTGRDPASLSRAPFQADCLFDADAALLGRSAYLPPCMNAFVGADITCAALAVGLCERSEPALLCDIGTNGELALWTGARLYVTSTAAGPAFEGAGISCGCGSVRGAIDRVWVEGGRVGAHTIGEAPAVGVCGSGLIDAIAALLQLGEIDETGAAERERLPLRDGICLLPRDVRAVQLAKAAIAAGIDTLLDTAAVRNVPTVFIAGGFGSHLSARSAAAIGLLPRALAMRAQSVGNAALAGAALLLEPARRGQARAIAKAAQHVSLGGNPRFNERYMEQMSFPEVEIDS